jgi:S1/P1 Nuclease
MRKVIATLFAFFIATVDLSAFSAEGHRTIAAIAQQNLSPKAKLAVAAILENETLVDASVWPDEIKQPMGRLWQTPEARRFNHDHGDNKKWHYVNFPVGSKSYTVSSPFTSPHDIVHVINGCITVLEGGQFEKLTPKEALRWLVHLVGDIHQPLHAVTGYFNLADPNKPQLETNVAEIDRETGDAGGNALDFGGNGMHSLWDKILVNDVFRTDSPADLAAHVMQGVNPDRFNTSGKYQSWAAKWASDSMRVAVAAYADIEFGKATIGAHGELTAMNVTLTPSTEAYRAKFSPVIADQLRKGGVHLAQLLNAIDWDSAP